MCPTYTAVPGGVPYVSVGWPQAHIPLQGVSLYCSAMVSLCGSDMVIYITPNDSVHSNASEHSANAAMSCYFLRTNPLPHYGASSPMCRIKALNP